jgi:hypothetical protein
MATKKTSKKASKKSVGSKKTTAKKVSSKKSVAKKSPSKKSVSKKSPAEKSASKKSPSKKSASKKSSTKKSPRKYGPSAGKQVETEMREMHQGKLKSGRSGKKVTNPKQAIAIGLSEARKKGAKVPPNPNK